MWIGKGWGSLVYGGKIIYETVDGGTERSSMRGVSLLCTGAIFHLSHQVQSVASYILDRIVPWQLCGEWWVILCHLKRHIDWRHNDPHLIFKTCPFLLIAIWKAESTAFNSQRLFQEGIKSEARRCKLLMFSWIWKSESVIQINRI